MGNCWCIAENLVDRADTEFDLYKESGHSTMHSTQITELRCSNHYDISEKILNQ